MDRVFHPIYLKIFLFLFLQLKRMEQVLGLAYLNKLYVCMVVNYL